MMSIVASSQCCASMRIPDFGKCENKDADQLCSNCTADQCLCFRFPDSTIPVLLEAKRNKLLAFFCDCTGRFVPKLVGRPKTGFLMSQIYSIHVALKSVVGHFQSEKTKLIELHNFVCNQLQIYQNIETSDILPMSLQKCFRSYGVDEMSFSHVMVQIKLVEKLHLTKLGRIFKELNKLL